MDGQPLLNPDYKENSSKVLSTFLVIVVAHLGRNFLRGYTSIAVFLDENFN
jgi:hypothetical protein